MTKPSEFTNAIMQELMRYPPEAAEAMERAVETVTDKTLSTVKRGSPRRSGAYGGSWRKRKMQAAKFEKKSIIHNVKHYRLTHLLEDRHLTRGGKYSKAKPHIKPAEEEAIRELPKEIEKEIKKVGR